MKKFQERNREKFYRIADQRIIEFHERFMDIIRKIFKGKLIFRFNIDNYEIAYELYLDVGKNYRTTITFDEILSLNFNSSVFIETFIEYVKHDYLKNILN